MIQLKRKQTYAIAAIAIGIMLAFIVPAVNRIGKPKFEGKTADEWLDYAESEFVRRGEHDSSPGSLFHELMMKELTVALASFGEDTQRNLIRDFLYLKSPSGFKTKLNNLNNKLPPSVRMTAFADPRIRHSLISDAIRELNPSWNLVEPHIEPITQKGDQKEIYGLINLLGFVGDGATNGVPFLLQVRTNGFPGVALQSLRDLEIAAAPAVPALVEDMRVGRVTINHLQILGTLGAKATEAIPDLESLFDNPPPGIDSKQIASVILSIEPDHQKALNHLDEYLNEKSTTQKLEWNDWNYLQFISGPNKPAAGLVLKYLDQSKVLSMASGWLIKLDPETGFQLLHEKMDGLQIAQYPTMPSANPGIASPTTAQLKTLVSSMNYIYLLLQHDPYNEVALRFLNEKIPSGAFIRHYITALKFCYSDSPGVIEALNKAESATKDKRELELIKQVRRHIELNDKLRELKKNTH